MTLLIWVQFLLKFFSYNDNFPFIEIIKAQNMKLTSKDYILCIFFWSIAVQIIIKTHGYSLVYDCDEKYYGSRKILSRFLFTWIGIKLFSQWYDEFLDIIFFFDLTLDVIIDVEVSITQKQPNFVQYLLNNHLISLAMFEDNWII